MKEELRHELIETLDMISSLERQKEYYPETGIGFLLDELSCEWFDDGYFDEDTEFDKAFTADEWSFLLEFHSFFREKIDLLREEVPSSYSDPRWLEVVNKAKKTIEKIGKDGF